MSQKVQRTKKSANLSVAIISIILALIPVIIVLFTGTSSFRKPYGIYTLATFGIVLYFSVVVGMFSWKNKILYLILDIFNIVFAIGFVIFAYINSKYQGGLLLHISAAFFLTLSFYQMCDADQGDSYYTLYFVPVLFDLAGLIFVLWFIGVHMSVVVHIILVTLFNLFNLFIFFIPSVSKLISHSNEYFAGLSSDSLEYEEETEEEIKERKELKAAQKTLMDEERLKERKEIEEDKQANSLHNANGYHRWYAFPSSVDRHRRILTSEFNTVIRCVNLQIDRNNYVIRNDDNIEYVKNAVKSNKQLKSGCKYLRKRFDIMQRSLDELSKKVFTTEDCYKKFVFSILDGKWKVKPSNEEKPTLDLMWAKVYFTAITETGYKEKYELFHDGENDFYLKPLD